MRSVRTQPNLFTYRDYRVYLKDWFEATRQTRARVSYRTFAKRAGFKSSNFIMLVIQGKRNLTEESLQRVVTGLRLNKQEEEFFRHLVFFNQAETLEEKNLYYRRLIRSRKLSELKPIERQQFEYYSAWYHPVIRELIASKDFDGTTEWIASRLSPSVTPAQVRRSIELLEGLGFIEKDGPDRWKQSSPIISTGPELTSLIVHNYHKLLLDLTKAKMDTLTTRERDVSALTLGVRKERIPELREKIREFRRDILKTVVADTEPEEVFQLNIQFYPVTVGAAVEPPSGGYKDESSS